MGSLTIVAFSESTDRGLQGGVGVPLQCASGVELVPAYLGAAAQGPGLAGGQPSLLDTCRDALRVAAGEWVAFAAEPPRLAGASGKASYGELSDGLVSEHHDIIIGRGEIPVETPWSGDALQAGAYRASDLRAEHVGWLLDRSDGRIYRRSTASAVLDSVPQGFSLGQLTPFILNAGVTVYGSGSFMVLPTVADVVLPLPDEWPDGWSDGPEPTSSALQVLDDVQYSVDLLRRFAEVTGASGPSYFETKCALLTALDHVAIATGDAGASLREEIKDLTRHELKRVVMLTADLSSVGGIQSRTRKVLAHTTDRAPQFVGVSVNNDHGARVEGNLSFADDPDGVRRAMSTWHPTDTAIVFPNNALRLLPEDVLHQVERFPLVFLGSGQLTFMLQDSHVLADLRYVDRLKVTKMVLLSRMDQQVYRQLGIYDHVRGFNPVQVRVHNNYHPDENKYVGYVGRIDFHTKGAERLVEAAMALRQLGLPPLRIFTVSSRKNSPDLDRFLEILESRGLRDSVWITYDETDLESIYGSLSLLLLPSKKDSFPNVILEANSFGVPVMGMSYAPGPAEVIVDGETGFLVDDFRSTTVSEIVSQLTPESLQLMSKRAFEWHKRFDMESYCQMLEGVCREAVYDFAGVNQLRVYPRLKPIVKLHAQVSNRVEAHNELKAEYARVKEERRRLSSELRRRAREVEALRASSRFRLGSIVAQHSGSLGGWLRMPILLARFVVWHLRARR